MSNARNIADLAGDTSNLEAISSAYGAGALSNRNLIINGAMQVAQRGTSAAITSAGYASLDRFYYELGGSATGRATISQSSDAPAGFGASYKVEVTTADAAPSAAYEYSFKQRLEGQNLQALKKGTANAESVTVSFWVKSSITGTFIVELMDNDNSNRHINKSYTISSADTWEYKKITFEGDTTGALNNDNGNSLHLQFWHGAGSQFTSGSLQTTWGTLTQANRAVGQTNLYATLSNTWHITGVQLEVGDTATPFEHRSYGQELALCQRYYWQSNDGAGGGFPLLQGVVSASSQYLSSPMVFPVELRATPTCAVSGTWQTSNVSAIQAEFQSKTGVTMRILSSGSPTIYAYANSSDDYISADAEL